ncbi:hypothetical protein [Chryseobacterium sp. SIMBA_029]|uniref:hypothetical protein n=1 Tax=Chryseobacterium sp. SIMBA_029 TaxID=3085772 RepID=UPI00397B014B
MNTLLKKARMPFLLLLLLFFGNFLAQSTADSIDIFWRGNEVTDYREKIATFTNLSR